MARYVMVWLLIIMGMVVLFNYFNTNKPKRQELSYSEFLQKVNENQVKTVVIKDKIITGEFIEDSKQFETYSPNDPKLVDQLQEHKVKIYAKPLDNNPWYTQVLMSWLPLIILVGIWIFFMRQMQGGAGNRAFSFGKSRAKMMARDDNPVTFKDVAGIEEAKEELEEIIDFLKDPKKFQRLGGKIPKGVLLIGSPGTGKTLLARAVAGEANVAFFSISGSDFVEMFVGVGAARIRDLFEQGKKNAPCIIFMDEIDAVGRHRGAGLGGSHDEREQTLNALLVEMDGFESSDGVILLAATNRPDVLDPALLRPGRFDRQVIVPRPDYKGRYEILKVHSKGIPLDDGVKLDDIARGTPGFAGAELANLVNEAALSAARRNRDKVTNEDFEDAKDKVTMGKERRSMVITEKNKKVTAYHESGHAIVGKLIPDCDPVHKVSIIPRGMALGVTMTLPQDDTYTYTKEFLIARITMMLGGRAAESIVYNHYTTGASNDIERATDIAKKMVTAWGMSEAVGPLAYAKKDEAVFLGKEIGTQKDYSEETAVLIDSEIKSIILSCYEQALAILQDNRVLLDKMAELLIDKETIDAIEINDLIKEYISDKWRQKAMDIIEAQKEESAKGSETVNY